MLQLKLYQFNNQETLLAYKLYYRRNNTFTPIILAKTNISFSYGQKNEQNAERNKLN